MTWVLFAILFQPNIYTVQMVSVDFQFVETMFDTWRMRNMVSTASQKITSFIEKALHVLFFQL